MNKAMWEGKTLIADEVAKEYEYEKQIRLASRAGDLLCIDHDCKNNILRYCHGDKRGAYFAHRSTDYSCSYGEFDKENTDNIRELTSKLKNVFESQGFKAEVEKKVFDRHYAHLVIKKNALYTAIEIVDNRLSVEKANYLTNQYESIMNVAWIVIDDIENPILENRTYYAKRFLLNEGNGKNLVVVDYDCNRVNQYRCDFNDYRLENGSRYFAKKELFVIEGLVEDLIINDSGIRLDNFEINYKNWISNRNTIFQKEIKRIQQEKNERNKRRKKYEEELKRKLKERQQQAFENGRKLKEKNKLESEQEEKPDAKDWIRIRESLNQQETPVEDCNGNRWIKCKYCGKVAKAGEFKSYGGLGEINLGCCRNMNCETIHEKQQTIGKSKENKEKLKKDRRYICEICGGKLVEKNGRYGKFLSCSNYPKCKNTRSIKV